MFGGGGGAGVEKAKLPGDSSAQQSLRSSALGDDMNSLVAWLLPELTCVGEVINSIVCKSSGAKVSPLGVELPVLVSSKVSVANSYYNHLFSYETFSTFTKVKRIVLAIPMHSSFSNHSCLLHHTHILGRWEVGWSLLKQISTSFHP